MRETTMLYFHLLYTERVNGLFTVHATSNVMGGHDALREFSWITVTTNSGIKLHFRQCGQYIVGVCPIMCQNFTLSILLRFTSLISLKDMQIRA